MKKLLVAILAVLYLGTSTGATVTMHYCMGKLVDWGLGQHKQDTCSYCGMEMAGEKDNGCCKDEHTQVKLEKDQKVSESVIHSLVLLSEAAPLSFIEIATLHFSSVTQENPVSHAPPGDGAVAIYLLHRVFRI